MHATPLRPGFRAAGAIALALLAAPFAYVAAQETLRYLTQDEIREVIIGRKIISTTQDGQTLSERYHPDGKIKGVLGNSMITAKWKFKGDLMCFDYQGSAHDACWYVWVNGDKAYWTNEAGTRVNEETTISE